MDILHVHRLATVGKAELVLLLAAAWVAKTKGAVGTLSRYRVVSVLVVIREVLLDNVESLHVNLLVCVGLALVDLLHASALLDKQGVTVDRVLTLAGGLLVKVADLEDVLKAVKSNLDYLVVGARQKVAQRLDAALSNQVPDLIRLLQATRSSVADSPARLLSRLQVAVRQEVDQRGDDVGINNRLYLRRVTSGDVRDGPARLLSDAILVGSKQGEQAWQSTAVDDDLRLHIIAGDNVTDGAQGRSLDRGGRVHKQLDKPSGNTGLDNSLDLIVGAIRKVRNSPACIDQNLVIERVNKLGENREGRCDLYSCQSVVGQSGMG